MSHCNEVQDARTLQAARSGPEWGIFQSTVNGLCAGSTGLNNAAFAGFSVELQCTSTTHTDVVSTTGTIVTYRLVAIASSGIYGSLDYVQRSLLAIVSLDPP
ncbi:MAG: hypothetical protein LJE92_01595 [Gammaproteobacteria bacterium]|jgi:hypothetical protein|nr:hypothetical protein [Gammaproteobacteria bacterium]